MTPGQQLRDALTKEQPLQVGGVINAYAAKLAVNAGFNALYLSGSGVATASYGLPDLGLTNLSDVLIDVRRISNAVDAPLLVDADTGWGNALSVARTVRELIQAGAAGCHIEDQVADKRCGHRPEKKLVSEHEMVARLKAAVSAKTDSSFVVMARTDAVSVEGLDVAISRAKAYVSAGADMIFAEAITDLADYAKFVQTLKVPILANITEFGRTPLFTREELASVGVQLVLYPLSAFRAMSAAAQEVYQTIRQQGTQEPVISRMQTRDELYEVLDYQRQEKLL